MPPCLAAVLFTILVISGSYISGSGSKNVFAPKPATEFVGSRLVEKIFVPNCSPNIQSSHFKSRILLLGDIVRVIYWQVQTIGTLPGRYGTYDFGGDQIRRLRRLFLSRIYFRRFIQKIELHCYLNAGRIRTSVILNLYGRPYFFGAWLMKPTHPTIEMEHGGTIGNSGYLSSQVIQCSHIRRLGFRLISNVGSSLGLGVQFADSLRNPLVDLPRTHRERCGSICLLFSISNERAARSIIVTRDHKLAEGYSEQCNARKGGNPSVCGDFLSFDPFPKFIRPTLHIIFGTMFTAMGYGCFVFLLLFAIHTNRSKLALGSIASGCFFFAGAFWFFHLALNLWLRGNL